MPCQTAWAGEAVMMSDVARMIATLSVAVSLLGVLILGHTVHSLVDRYSSAASFQVPPS